MQLSNIPQKLVLPWAASGLKNSIPVNSQTGITPGAASLTDGFPPLTMTPVAAGGVPPSGLDMNGILYEMSAILRWANAGGGYAYDSDFANDSHVGGYPKGARVMRSDGNGYWFNTVNNNTSDPEAAGAAAAGWVPDYQFGATSVPMSDASVTLTPAQYGKPLIVITGALSANLNLIFPAIAAQEWTVINNTTGGYSVTAKTASGLGVSLGEISQIIGDGVNIYSAYADSAQVVKNVATLRNISPTLSRRMQTKGYYSDGDGGGGQYFGRVGAAPGTYVDNGGTVIVPNGGDGSAAWLLDTSGKVGVKQFGAKGDGSSIDTAPIQSAVTNLKSIYFPNGIYLIDDPIREATNGGGRRLYGENQSYTIIKATESFTDSGMIWFGNSSGHGAYYGAIENLTIDGWSAANNLSGIVYQSCGLSRVQNVTMQNCGRAAWMHGCIDTAMIDCNVFGCYEGPYWDIYPIGVPSGPDDMTAQATQTTLSNQSSMIRCWLSGIEANAVYISGSNFLLEDCVFQSCTDSAVHDVVRVVDSNESFDYGAGPIIRGNWFEGGTYRYAIHVENTRQTRIFDNFINGAAIPGTTTMQGGIWLDANSVKNVEIENNSIRGYFTATPSYATNAAIYITSSAFSHTAQIGPNYIVTTQVNIYWEGLTSPTADRHPLPLSASISISAGAGTVDFQTANFISSIIKNGTGDFSIIYRFNRQSLAAGKYPILVFPHTSGGGITYQANHFDSNAGNDRILFTDNAGAAADPAGFTIQLLSGGWQQI